MNLLPELKIPVLALHTFYKTEVAPSNGQPLSKERIGLKKNSKLFTQDEWNEVYHIIDDLADADSKVEDFKTFGSVGFWLDAGFSISKILRFIASVTLDFEVTSLQRRALHLVFQIIIQEGAVTKHYNGNTLINRNKLTKTLQDLQIRNGVWVKQGKEFACSMETDSENPNEVLNLDEVEINTILNYAIENEFLGSVIYEGEEHIYSIPHAKLEKFFLQTLRSPPSEQVIADIPDCLTAEQKQMFRAVIASTTRGVINLGEPGTGKTYTANEYIKATGPENWLVLATTGTAAQVLQASVPEGVACYTISWAAFNLDKVPLKRYVLVDECSMLNITFQKQFKKIIEAQGFEKIVLLGDPHQLPPVGVGAFFASFDEENNYGVDLVQFREQKRMSQKSMRNLRGLTAMSSTSYDSLFGFQYAEVPFYTQPSEGQYAVEGSITALLKAFEQKLDRFDETKMRNKETRYVVSTYKKRWADFYSEMIEGFRRSLPMANSIVEILEKIENYYVETPLIFDDKPWKCDPLFIVWEVVNCLWSDKGIKKRDRFKLKYKEVMEDIELLASLKSQLHSEILKGTMASGGFYRSNYNIWTTKISLKKLNRLKTKYKIEELYGDVANGTKFLCSFDEQGRQTFTACDTKGLVKIVFAPDAKIFKLMSLAWVQTTHKLQGDQGESSLYIHDKEAPMSLIYVALSRGRKFNRLVTQHPMWKGPKIICHKNHQRLSTICATNEINLKAGVV